MGKFGAVAADTVDKIRESLVANLRNFAPVLKSLADAGPALTRGLDMLVTYPWPKSTVANWFRGDYANITMVIDLTLSRHRQPGYSPVPDGRATLPNWNCSGAAPSGCSQARTRHGNPLTFPYHDGGY